VAPSIHKKLAISSPTSGGRSVGIVRSQAQIMEFSFMYLRTGTNTTEQHLLIKSGMLSAPADGSDVR
jgi:hypothetical protein